MSTAKKQPVTPRKPTSLRRRLGRSLLVLLLLISLPVIVGVIWQVIATIQEQKSYPPPGKLVDVGGHKLHLNCSGQGSPTVILEGGVPEWSLHWQAVQPGVAQFTRVCSYDRAGFGWSEPGLEPRSAQRIVEELHTLLVNAGESGPYVLAAHSFWGPAALLFQHTYPGEVSGMLLIESWSPHLFSPVPEIISQSLPLAKSFQTLAALGQVRLLGETGLLPLEETLQAGLLPAELRPAYKAAYYQSSFWGTMHAEYSALPESAQQVQNLGSLGDLPLVVLQAGTRQPGDYPPDEIWDATQQGLAQLSTRGQLVVVPGSGHFVQLEQPQIVIEVIRGLVDVAK